MRRDKTVARIVLVLSVVHGALAAPVVVRRYLDLAESLTAASEKRSLDDESSHPGPVVSMPTSDSKVAPGDSYFTARSSTSVSNRYLTTPISGALQLHDDPPPALGTLQMRYDPPGTSGTPQVHNDPPPTSGAPSSQDNLPPESGDPLLHNDPTTSTLETPQVHGGLSSSSSEFGEPNLGLNNVHSTPSGSSGSGVPWDDQHPVVGHEVPQGWPFGLQPPEGWPFTQQETNSDSEADRFYNNVKKKELLVFGGLVTALAMPWGVSYGIHKWIDSHGNKPASRDLASGDVVGRGASMHP